MIQNSFIFLPGLGKQGELNLWKQGITDWSRFLDAKDIKGLSKKRKLYYDRHILEARKALSRYDAEFFADFPEPWRLYEHFKEDAVFLDIETCSKDNVTIIGLYNGIETKTMLNFDPKVLKKELNKYKMIVTFNGSAFDIPRLEKHYPNIIPKIPHFDLKPSCVNLGLRGGLKEVEITLGLKRPQFLRGDVADLYRAYKASGDKEYLDLLIQYNEEDTMNLKPIANHIYNKMKTFLKEYIKK